MKVKKYLTLAILFTVFAVLCFALALSQGNQLVSPTLVAISAIIFWVLFALEAKDKRDGI